jgi:3-oxoacyl-[acyl-carrier protein] reductase
MDLGLKGRVALVAAGSQGLGRAVAREFAREGARVAVCARNAEALDSVAAELGQSTDALACVADVTRPEEIRAFVQATLDRFGQIDICVTNAGGPPAKPFSETTADDWRRAIDLNLMSTVHFAHLVLPHMAARGSGRFLAITSVSVKQPIDGLVLSNSVRAAVVGLTKTLANEYGPRGVLVHSLCPGYTATDRLNDLADRLAAAGGTTPDQIRQGWGEAAALRRVGTPEEFAAVVAFLASDRASFMTGTAIPVDGGWVKGIL